MVYLNGFCRIVLLVVVLLLGACISPNGVREEIEFKSTDDVILQGTLIQPNQGPGPFPAIVILHGAERATRDRMIYSLTANVFLDKGIAVFVYDKRGAGDSGGDHDTKTYRQLIDDAIAAMSTIKSHPSIDSNRVGLMGISESGWLAPEIAERSGAAYVINKVASALSVQETIAWEVYNELLDEGVTEASAHEQLRIYQRIWQYRTNPTPAEQSALLNVLAEWRDRPDSQLPGTLKAVVSLGYVEDISYDPTPFLERLQTPVLFLYGTDDVNIPTAKCVTRLDDLAKSERPVTYLVFDGEGHELGGFSPLPPFYAFADGFASAIGEFAATHSE